MPTGSFCINVPSDFSVCQSVIVLIFGKLSSIIRYWTVMLAAAFFTASGGVKRTVIHHLFFFKHASLHR